MGTRPKVLVIDDDASFIGFISALLRVAGYAPVVAFDAMQGLMFAQREGPAVILLDLNMPAGGGMQLLERLQKSPKAQGVPSSSPPRCSRGSRPTRRAKGRRASSRSRWTRTR